MDTKSYRHSNAKLNSIELLYSWFKGRVQGNTISNLFDVETLVNNVMERKSALLWETGDAMSLILSKQIDATVVQLYKLNNCTKMYSCTISLTILS